MTPRVSSLPTVAIFAFVAGFLTAAASSAQQPATDDAHTKSPVVATVNGEPIRVEQLERRLGSMHARAEASSRSGFDLANLVDRLINDTLLAQEARALEMHLEEPTRGRVERYRDALAVEQLETEEIAAKAAPTGAEVRAAFEKDYRRVTFRAVTVDEKTLAERLLERVKGGEDIARIARELSVDPYAARGGLVDAVPFREIRPEIREPVFARKPGELFGPHLTDFGWAIFEVVGFEPADGELFERVKPGLTERLRFEKGQSLRENLAREVLENHEVVVKDAVVESVSPERGPDGRLKPRVANGDAVAVLIDGKPAILAGEYAQALMARWGSVRSEEAARAAAPIILRKLLDRHLLLAEARKRGFTTRPEILDAAYDYETELLVQRYLEEIVAPEVRFERDDMLAYYEQNKSSFRKPPRLHLGQITVPTEDEAHEVARQLRSGTDLAWLAKQRSTDRFADKGGDRGWYVPSPASSDFDRELLQADVGSVMKPIGSGGNWRVIKVTAREERGIYSFDEVSGNVRERVFSETFSEALDRLFATLRERSEILRNEKVLDALSVSGQTAEDAPAMGGPHGS